MNTTTRHTMQHDEKTDHVMTLDEARRRLSVEERRSDLITSAARGQGPTFIAAKLDMLIGEFRVALIDVIPPNRSKGTCCWCDHSHDLVRYGHQPKCVQARRLFSVESAKAPQDDPVERNHWQSDAHDPTQRNDSSDA